MPRILQRLPSSVIGLEVRTGTLAGLKLRVDLDLEEICATVDQARYGEDSETKTNRLGHLDVDRCLTITLVFFFFVYLHVEDESAERLT